MELENIVETFIHLWRPALSSKSLRRCNNVYGVILSGELINLGKLDMKCNNLTRTVPWRFLDLSESLKNRQFN